MRKIFNSPYFYRIADIIFGLFAIPGILWLRLSKYIGLYKLPFTKNVLHRVGVFPIVDHYYEPFFKFDSLNLQEGPRNLQIDWNDGAQLSTLDQFHFNTELRSLRMVGNGESDPEYYFKNGAYSGIDAEYLYSIIRSKKPAKIIEIGSGFSTKLMKLATDQNHKESGNTNTEIICIEPYEMKWLENFGVNVMRKKVEDVPLDLFAALGENDILFIDSSHMIRPQGDVLYEIFQIFPVLKSGVLIHIHDIFSPFDYPKEWFIKDNRMWNEQYLVEAFLMNNKNYEIIGALSYLGYKYPDNIAEKFPNSRDQNIKKGGAIWLKKIS